MEHFLSLSGNYCKDCKEAAYIGITALSEDKGDKIKCLTCNKLHSGQCTKVKNTAALNGNKKLCPVCDKSAHKSKNKARGKAISKHVKDCLAFKSAIDNQKQAMIKRSSWFMKLTRD